MNKPLSQPNTSYTSNNNPVCFGSSEKDKLLWSHQFFSLLVNNDYILKQPASFCMHEKFLKTNKCVINFVKYFFAFSFAESSVGKSFTFCLPFLRENTPVGRKRSFLYRACFVRALLLLYTWRKFFSILLKHDLLKGKK